MRMDYTQLFRSLREAKSLTLEQLASASAVHRNTVVNIEGGRPVKFKTIALLMQKMGYAPSSPEMKSMALLWLEKVSGIPFSRAEPGSTAKKTIETYRTPARQSAHQLCDAVIEESLSPAQIDVLLFAARHPEVMSIIESVRDFAQGFTPGKRGKAFLQAAEDPGPYGKKR
jgi:transcriptional regulator with XRE-family HTH domain